MYARYKGPMVVIRRAHGGAYILAEMDGTVLKDKVAAFRVMPHWARYKPIELPEDIHELIDLNPDQLEAMVEDNDEVEVGRDFIFDAIPNLRINKLAEWDWDQEEDLAEVGKDFEDDQPMIVDQEEDEE